MAERRDSLCSGWDELMRIQREDLELSSSTDTHLENEIAEKPLYVYCTESSYIGEWNVLGMQGTGSFCFPNGVNYEGKLRDGTFHGCGTLTYPMGQKFDSVWNMGKAISFTYKLSDNFEYSDPWKYCEMPDRRFLTCILDGLRPAGRSLLTNDEIPRRIPKDCYDTCDGYYNPKTKCVMSAANPGNIIRIPTATEEEWIKKHCRKAWDEPTKFKPELYEHWVTGRKTDSVFDSSSKTSGSNDEMKISDTEYIHQFCHKSSKGSL